MCLTLGIELPGLAAMSLEVLMLPLSSSSRATFSPLVVLQESEHKDSRVKLRALSLHRNKKVPTYLCRFQIRNF